MKLANDIEAIGLALRIGKNLVICDVHIGYEEYLNKTGVMVPRLQFRETLEQLKKIAEGRHFEKIIINGDIKHEFGTISEQEWRHTLRLLDFLKKYCNEIILVKGNHDTILGPIADKRDIKVKDYYLAENSLIAHGDRLICKLTNNGKVMKTIKNIIIGHEHPAISLKERAHTETYKCYLVGKYRGKNLIVQPSFNLVTEGTDVLKERLLSPYLKNISDFKVYVVEDDINSETKSSGGDIQRREPSPGVLFFGKIRDLRTLFFPKS